MEPGETENFAGLEAAFTCRLCEDRLDHEDLEMLPCGHAFHVDCLRPWLAHCAREKRSLTCPTCRTPVCPAATPDVEAGDVVPVNSGLE